MKTIESRLPHNAKVFSIGSTVEGREMMGIRVSIFSVSPSPKRTKVERNF